MQDDDTQQPSEPQTKISQRRRASHARRQRTHAERARKGDDAEKMSELKSVISRTGERVSRSDDT